MSSFAPVAPVSDDAARERIRNSLHENLLVEASAGTGKTTELVRRIVAVLRAGIARVDQIAAVTFTNKAAGELKLRLRQGLDRARQDATGANAQHLEHALAHLEEASIGTIHAFCAQILRERPVEAGVDPDFKEAAEQECERIYQRAFQAWFGDALNQPSPGLRRALTRMAWPTQWEELSPLDQLKYAGRQVLEWRDFPAEWARLPFDRQGEIDELVRLILVSEPRLSKSTQTRPVRELAEWITRAEAVSTRDYDTLEARLVKLHKELRGDKRKGLEALRPALEKFVIYAGADLAAEVRQEMSGLIDRYEWQKRQTGQLDFLDLLVLARNVVRDNAGVRRYLQNRFTRLFIDEFQDTDPLQAELLLLLAADDADETNWLRVRPADGKLFVVGDPKQSIYKFRRADVALYQQLRQRLVERGAGLVRLTRSFRSTRPIQLLVNAAFAPEMTGDEGAGQIEYSALEEHTPAIGGQPAIVSLPVPRPYGQRDVAKYKVEQELPDTIAAYIDWLLQSGWQVRDPQRGDGWTAIAPRHICVLFRRKTNLGQDIAREYTRRLEDRGIPHLLAGSKSLHAREEMETLRVAATAIEWPGDELSVFATLRGALFAIDDALLLRYRHYYKRLDPFHLPEEPGDYRPITDALGLLASLHRSRNWQPIAGTINQLLEATRAHAGVALRPGGRQALANLYRLTELARSYEMEGGISFRGFVDMLIARSERGETAEAPVLEEGAEGVRLMTVHGAKGLEFPVVILADITANLARTTPERYVSATERLCATQILSCSPYELVANQEIEHRRELAEGVRVAYVAATRARDLLVVPAVGDKPVEGWTAPLNKALYPPYSQRRKAALAEGCPPFGGVSVLDRPFVDDEETSVQPGLHQAETGEHAVVWWDPAALSLDVKADHGMHLTDILSGGGAAAESQQRYADWKAQRNALLARGLPPQFTVFTATQAQTEPPGPPLPVTRVELPKTAGRAKGPRFGSLVHALLRDVRHHAADLRTLASVHARLLGATTAEVDAAVETVEAALRSDVLQRALRAPKLHHEWPLKWKDGSTVFEGVIDLAFYEPDHGWTVLDYKTDVAGVLPAAYDTQVRWYAFALSRLTGEPVEAVILNL